MPRESLRKALDTLHAELESSEALSAEDRAQLVSAMADIQQALSESTPPADSETGALSERVYALIEEFESTHPKFAEILRNVSESLANLGI